MKKVVVLLITFSFIHLSAQSNYYDSKSLYFSGNLAIYKSTDNEAFRYGGSSRIGGGVGFGLRIADNVMLYTRAQIISKSDFNGYYDNRYLDTELKVVHTIGTANASVSQLIVNSGIQYNIFLTEEFTLGIIGGLTYTMIDQEARSLSGNILQHIDNEWFHGYFGGASIEKYFKDSDFTLFGEVLYNYIDENSLYFRDAFSGLNFTVGGRYYLLN